MLNYLLKVKNLLDTQFLEGFSKGLQCNGFATLDENEINIQIVPRLSVSVQDD